MSQVAKVQKAAQKAARRFFIVVSFSMVAVGCANKKEKHQAVFAVGDAFISHVRSFEQDSAIQGYNIQIDDLIVEFGSSPNVNETGVCEIAEDETPRVVINATIWNTLTEDDREEVIYHELGHCVLRRNHQSGEVMGYNGTFSIPASVMYPYRIPGHVYRANDVHYHGELFDTGKFNQF